MSSELVLASTQLSQRLGVEKGAMLATIKAQCFKSARPDEITDAQLAAFVSVAQAVGVNPLLPGMLYAYPERNGGIMPIVGPDGVFSMLSSNPEIEGWSTKHETIDGEPACTATIKHKRLGDITKTVFLSEWKVGNNPNWATRPRHMLEIRALKQCARQVIHGVPLDEDERSEALKNVTHSVGATVDPSQVDGPLTGSATVESAQQGQPEGQRPKSSSRRGTARASAEIVVPPEQQQGNLGQPPAQEAKAPPAEGQVSAATDTTKAAEPTSTTDEKTATPAPASAAAPVADKPKDTPAGSAQETPAGNSKPAPSVPELVPGIGMGGFKGRAWPLVENVEIVKIVKTAVTPAGVPLIIFDAKVAGIDLPMVTLEHVKLDAAGVPQITSPLIAVGKQVNAKLEAKLRGGKTDVPPAIWASSITETAEQF